MACAPQSPPARAEMRQRPNLVLSTFRECGATIQRRRHFLTRRARNDRRFANRLCQTLLRIVEKSLPDETSAQHDLMYVVGQGYDSPTARTDTKERRGVNRVVYEDNLAYLKTLPDGSIPLIYIDPPFNTGKPQTRAELKMRRAEVGDRTGFQGKRYETIQLGVRSFADAFDDFLAFLEPRLREAYRVLAPNGSFYLHIDYREAHYCKVLLDLIFGRECFLNEIIWAYDFGARTQRRWPTKHDTILLYVKDPENYVFNAKEIDREPYMAPGLVGPEKAARGKLPTDVWWHTIVSPTGREKTGYPTQKPLGVLRRIITASSQPGDTVLDFFAGSGTTGAAALDLGRRFILVDSHEEALTTMARRFAGDDRVTFEGFDRMPRMAQEVDE